MYIDEFKVGDIVKMKVLGTWCYGEITIIRKEDKTAKILFEEDYAPNYDYYPLIELYQTDWKRK